MERITRFGFVGGLIAGGVIVGLIWLGDSGAFDLSSSHLPYGYRDIASIHLQPVPEGPVSPFFRPHPTRIDDQPLALVADLIPDPLPRPLNQPFGCDHGGDLIVMLKNGKQITYGPCSYPWQISQLWGAMIQTADMTEPSRPNRAAIANIEQVRQSLKDALERHVSGAGQFLPLEIVCAPVASGRDQVPPGYLCSAMLRSDTAATGVLHRSYCVALVAGRISYASAPAAGLCKMFQ
jgi:hypothetical protein